MTGKNQHSRRKGRKMDVPYKSEKVAYFKHIGPHAEGQTLLDFLCSRFTYFKAEQWMDLIRKGDVQLNEKNCDGQELLKAGDKVSYMAMTRPEPPVPDHIPVLYEDEDLLIVNKPPHIPVHPTGRYLRNTMIHILQKNRKNSKLFLAHRLDRETSGVCVLSKTHLAKEKMYWQFFHSKVDKTYWGLVWGEPSPRSGVVDKPLGTAQGPGSKTTSKIRIKQAVDGSGAKTAKTKYHTISTKWLAAADWTPPEWPQMTAMKAKNSKNADKWPISLVEASPITGRTNQIRVHLAHVGAGIVGDKLYDPDESTFIQFKELNKESSFEDGSFLRLDNTLRKRLILEAHALHARKLGLRHPRSNEWMEIVAPAPKSWTGLYQPPEQAQKAGSPKSPARTGRPKGARPTGQKKRR